MKTARSEATPRIHYGDGEWTLEYQELVAVERDLYRPATRRVRGVDAIVSHLRRSGADAQFREATTQLMRTRRDEPGWYEFTDGEWLSASLANKLRPEESVDRELDSTLTELRAEILVLRASHRTLKERVVRAEARVREEYADSPDELEREEFEAPAPAPVVALPSARPPAAAPANLASSAEVRDVSDEPDGPRVTLPPRNAILAAMKQLLGRDPELDYTPERAPAADALADYHASMLVDDAGRELGAVLVNARAIAELGGGLLGLPDGDIEQLANAPSPTEDSIAAMHEYCKGLASAASRASSELEVQAEPLAMSRPSRLAWLPRASKSVVLSNKAGAEVWLIAR